MTRNRRRHIAVLVATSAAVGTLLGFGSLSCSADTAANESDVITAVTSLHKALSAGDLTDAHRHIDYRHRLAETLGPLWQDAPEADRAAAVALAQGMFATTTERHWTTHFQGRTHLMLVRPDPKDPAARWVDVRATGGSQPPFVWTYRLHPSGSDSAPPRWRVTQREYQIDSFKSDTTTFYPTAIRRVAKTLSRPPSLAELNANLPSLVGRMRTRHITIPELPNLPGRP